MSNTDGLQMIRATVISLEQFSEPSRMFVKFRAACRLHCCPFELAFEQLLLAFRLSYEHTFFFSPSGMEF